MGPLQLACTILIVALMLDGGLRPPVGRVFSWPMYAWATAAVVDIEVATGAGDRQAVNLYDDFPAGEYLIPPDTLDLYLEYLGREHGEVTCTGQLYGPFGAIDVRWEASCVDDPEPR